MRPKTILIFALCTLVVPVMGQTTGAFTKTVIIGGSGTSVDYYVPATYNATKAYKVIVNLEKASQGHYTTYADTADGIVIGTDVSNYQFVKELVDSTNLTYNLDTNSIYLTGFSARGHKCLEIGLANYSYFKGLIPLAPNSSAGLSYPNSQFIPSCIVTGTADGFINTSVAIHGLMTFQSGIVDTLFPFGVAHTPTGPDARTPDIHRCFQWINLNQPPGVGVAEQLGIDRIVIGPNPASNLIGVTINENHGLGELSIIDMNGRTVQRKSLMSYRSTISIEGLSNGVYVVQYKGEHGSAKAKLLVHH